MTEQKGLLPCQLCGVVLTRQGDYTNTEAWNWYGHPNADDSPCLLAQHRIPTLSDLHTPSPAEAARWNTRAQPAEDERVKEIARRFAMLPFWGHIEPYVHHLRGKDLLRELILHDVPYLLSRLPIQPAASTPTDRVRWLLTQIMWDLPANRDWLDPVIEAEAREVTGVKKTAGLVAAESNEPDIYDAVAGLRNAAASTEAQND